MENFRIDFNFEIHMWELIDTQDGRSVLDQSDTLEEMMDAYPSIGVNLPKGEMNKDLNVI